MYVFVYLSLSCKYSWLRLIGPLLSRVTWSDYTVCLINRKHLLILIHVKYLTPPSIFIEKSILIILNPDFIFWNSDLFPISIVYILGTMDFDQGPKFFSISVSATDGVLSGTTNLFIQLTDENDISPVITNTDFSITISESSPGG